MCLFRLGELVIGGIVVGIGFNVFDDFGVRVVVVLVV